jgi:ribosomal protein S10
MSPTLRGTPSDHHPKDDHWFGGRHKISSGSSKHDPMKEAYPPWKEETKDDPREYDDDNNSSNNNKENDNSVDGTSSSAASSSSSSSSSSSFPILFDPDNVPLENSTDFWYATSTATFAPQTAPSSTLAAPQSPPTQSPEIQQRYQNQYERYQHRRVIVISSMSGLIAVLLALLAYVALPVLARWLSLRPRMRMRSQKTLDKLIEMRYATVDAWLVTKVSEQARKQARKEESNGIDMTSSNLILLLLLMLPPARCHLTTTFSSPPLCRMHNNMMTTASGYSISMAVPPFPINR